jgi:diphthine-ammonia ligase
MCGIIGVFGCEGAEKIVDKGLKVMANRGKDGSDKHSFGKSGCIGHNLHAIVDLVKQPIEADGGLIVANCEIYNWKELDEKYDLGAKNDAEMLLRLLNKKSVEGINELDGVYAFCYVKDGKVVLARDLIGVKPIWYAFSSFLAFASEKKALLANGVLDVIELNPRKIIEYDIAKNKIKYIDRGFFKIIPGNKNSLAVIKKELYVLLEEAIRKRVTDKKIGVLFSGGIDSVFIAYMLKRMGAKFTCYTAALEEEGMEKAEDLRYAEKAAAEFGFELKVAKAGLKETEEIIKKIIELIETTDVVKVGVALPFYLASRIAKKDGVRVMFSGLGSEEIFAGYERHKKSRNVNEECVSGLLKMYERDLYRDDVITMGNTIELRLPFLDKRLVEHSLKIPPKYKIDEEQNKIILRKIAEDIGISKEFYMRKKKAAQYGSKFDRAIEKLTKKRGFKLKAEYLNSLSREHNLNLGIMWSTGKDSGYAAYLMKKHNYNIKCLLTMKSSNKYSYMFHTPNVDMAKIQATAMDVPLLIQETKGEKEHELKDLKKLLKSAKKEYNIDGIVTGALFSSYQRERIEKAADSVGLKIFSPLWHKDQEEEMREIINSSFKIVLSSTAAEGLDESWLGRVLSIKDVDMLAELNVKKGINIAGEGGEFESLVLDCPIFKKEIVITKSRIIKEDKLNYFFLVEKAELKEKTGE